MAKRKQDDSAIETSSESPVETMPREYHPQVETFASFCRRHGDFITIGEAHEVRPGVWTQSLLFHNGARALSTHPTNHGGVEPSSDLVQSGRDRLEYAQEKLRHETEAHAEFLKHCREQAYYHGRAPMSCPPPPANWKDQLADGEKRIARWTNRVAELNHILDKLDPERIARRARQEAQNEDNMRSQQLFDEVMTYGGSQVFAGNNGSLGGPQPM